MLASLIVRHFSCSSFLARHGPWATSPRKDMHTPRLHLQDVCAKQGILDFATHVAMGWVLAGVHSTGWKTVEMDLLAVPAISQAFIWFVVFDGRPYST